MTQTFDAGRWWLLVGKHWSENRKKYSLSLAAMAGLLFLWNIVAVLADRRAPSMQLQMNTYFFGLFVVGCLYASMMFSDLGSKTRGLNYLVVPASTLEKLLCSLFYAVLVFFVCYTALFYVLDIITVKAGNAVAYSRWLKQHATGTTFSSTPVANVFSGRDQRMGDQDPILYIYLAYFLLQSIFLAGSVYFARFSFIKTVIAAVLAGIIITFVIAKVIMPILPPGSYHNGISSYHVYTVKDAPGGGTMIYSEVATDKLVSLPVWIDKFLLFLLKYALIPLFWVVTYFRLKEKEI